MTYIPLALTKAIQEDRLREAAPGHLIAEARRARRSVSRPPAQRALRAVIRRVLPWRALEPVELLAPRSARAGVSRISPHGQRACSSCP